VIFNDAPSAAEDIKCGTEWENHHDFLKYKVLEGDGG
jgi:hypothetical protein